MVSRHRKQFTIVLICLLSFAVASCAASPDRGGDDGSVTPTSPPSVAVSRSQGPSPEITNQPSDSRSNATSMPSERSSPSTSKVQDRSPEPSPSAPVTNSPNPTDSPTGNDPTRRIEGDCNAQGSNNSVKCVRELPDRIGDVQLYRNDDATTYMFDGPVSRLPKPPEFGKDEAFFHCSRWSDWLTKDPNIYTNEPGGGVSAVKGEADQVAIVDYEVLIYTRKEIEGRKLTQVRCGWGGGRNNLWEMVYDTRSRKTVLRQFSSNDKGKSVPPAAINLVGANYTSVILSIDSSTKYLYSGRMIVTAIINGERKELAIGSPANPYRWIGEGSRNPVVASAPYWGWDQTKKQWVKNPKAPPGGE